MEADVAKITNRLQSEMHTLLCTTMKYASVKIPLKAASQSYSSDGSVDTIVNIQRGELGFYYPRSERGSSDLDYMNLKYYLDDNDNLFTKYETEDYQSKKKTLHDHLLVQLKDILKPDNSRRVFPDKIDTYFKFLREVMAYRKKFLCYLEEGQAHQHGLIREFKVDKLSFVINARSMDIEFKKIPETDEDKHYGGYNAHSNFQYKKASTDLFHMLDYSAPSSREYSGQMQRELTMFIDNYQAISVKLDKEEALKKKAYTTCEDFLRQIEVHTLPFKVLSELKK